MMTTKPTQPEKKLIYIEWADATSPIDTWWTGEQALKWAEEENYWVCQVGWIIEETPKYLVISSQKEHTVTANDTDLRYAHILKIPKTWLRKRKEIKL